jgi:hypothetical protein
LPLTRGGGDGLITHETKIKEQSVCPLFYVILCCCCAAYPAL